MLRHLLITTTAAAALAGCATEQGSTMASSAATPQRSAMATPVAAGAMQPGQRMMLGPMTGKRIRMVMFSDNGGTVDLIYDDEDPRTRTMSQRAVRLTNNNGMLEVVYDTSVPSMPVGTPGRVRRVENNGNGMVEIVYAR